MSREKEEENLAAAVTIIKSQPNQVLKILYEFIHQHLGGSTIIQLKKMDSEFPKLTSCLHEMQLRESVYERFSIGKKRRPEVVVDGERFGSLDSLDVQGLINKASTEWDDEEAGEEEAGRYLWIDRERIQLVDYTNDVFLENEMKGSSEVQKLMCSRDFDVVFDKMCIFQQGGYFKSHESLVVKGVNHAATIVLSLTSNYEGGDLVIKEIGGTATREHLNAREAAAFYNDAHHEVLPVTKGTRITLQYDVYLKRRKTETMTSWDAETNSAIDYRSGKLPPIVQLSNEMRACYNAILRRSARRTIDSCRKHYVTVDEKLKLSKPLIPVQERMMGLVLRHRYRSEPSFQELTGVDRKMYEYFFAEGHQCSLEAVILKVANVGFLKNDARSWTVIPVNPFDYEMQIKVQAVVTPSTKFDLEHQRIEHGGDSSIYYCTMLLVSFKKEKIADRVKLIHVGKAFTDLEIRFITTSNPVRLHQTESFEELHPKKKRKLCRNEE